MFHFVKTINFLIFDIFYRLIICKLFRLCQSVKDYDCSNEHLVKNSLKSQLRQNVCCCVVRWNSFLLVNVMVVELVKKFSYFYETRKFITLTTKGLYCILPRDRWSIPQIHTLLRYILILSFFSLWEINTNIFTINYLLTHWVDPILKSSQFCSYPRIP